jgi:hypothetical protein
MALFVRQLGGNLGAERQRGIIGKADRTAVIAADHAGFHAGCVELGGGVDMGQKADGRAGGGGRNCGQNRAIVGQGDVLGADLGQFGNQEPGHVQLNGG